MEMQPLKRVKCYTKMLFTRHLYSISTSPFSCLYSLSAPTLFRL